MTLLLLQGGGGEGGVGEEEGVGYDTRGEDPPSLASIPPHAHGGGQGGAP